MKKLIFALSFAVLLFAAPAAVQAFSGCTNYYDLGMQHYSGVIPSTPTDSNTIRYRGDYEFGASSTVQSLASMPKYVIIKGTGAIACFELWAARLYGDGSGLTGIPTASSSTYATTAASATYTLTAGTAAYSVSAGTAVYATDAGTLDGKDSLYFLRASSGPLFESDIYNLKSDTAALAAYKLSIDSGPVLEARIDGKRDWTLIKSSDISKENLYDDVGVSSSIYSGNSDKLDGYHYNAFVATTASAEFWVNISSPSWESAYPVPLEIHTYGQHFSTISFKLSDGGPLKLQLDRRQDGTDAGTPTYLWTGQITVSSLTWTGGIFNDNSLPGNWQLNISSITDITGYPRYIKIRGAKTKD